MGLFIGILLSACVAFQLSFNSFFPRAEQLYLTFLSGGGNGVAEQHSPYVYAPLAEALRENFPEQVKDAAVLREMDLWNYYNGDVRLSALTIYGDNHLFSTLGTTLLAGNPEDLRSSDAIFISQRMADKIREDKGWESVIGKQLWLDRKTPYRVRGVFKNQPENTDFPFDVVVSMWELWNRERAGWGFDISYKVIVRFSHPRQDVPLLEARLPELMKKYMPRFNEKNDNQRTFGFRPLTSVHTDNPTVLTMVFVMSILAVVLLVMAAFNYVLISVSSLSRRAKEVGVHKCNGAGRGSIFGLFLAETGMTVCFSVVLVGVLMYLFRDFVEDVAAVRLFSLFTWQTLWVPVLVVSVVFLLAGVLPAWLFSSIPVTQVFRRYTEHNASWKRPLLFIQFVGVAFIFCFLLVVLHQYRMVMYRPLGYDPTRVATCWAKVGGSYENRVQTFGSLPMVEDYTCASQLICEGYSGDRIHVGDGRMVNVRMDWVTRSFLPMMKIDLLEGHNFNPAQQEPGTWADNNEVIVNRTFVRQAGWEGSAIGRTFRLYENNVVVIGVMEDYPVYSAYKEQSPILVVLKENWGSTHYVRLKEPFAENLAALNRTMQEMFPADDVEFVSLESRLDEQYTDVRRFRNAVSLASVSIFLIALMGLLGYVSDEIGRRSKEIAIRKVNGAEAGDVIRLLTKEMSWIALPALLAGGVAASVFGDRWLDTFAERAYVGWEALAAVLLALALVIAVCMVLRTWQIANENPVKSIKNE